MLQNYLKIALRNLLKQRSFTFLNVLGLSVGLAAYFMKGWPAGYEYRTELHWWVFALSAVAPLAVAFLTVSFQSVKAALANPVKSLRSE